MEAKEYFRFAERYFRIYMFMTFVNGIHPVCSQFFTAIGKAAKGAVVSLTRQILFLLPLIIIFPIFIGIDGVMYAGRLKSDVRQSHAMFVIDVDNFKRVNDTWGREFGDIVLNDVAAVLRRIFRRSDYIGRIGDDEFLVLLRDVEPERLSEKRRRNFIRPSARCFPPVAMSAINRRVVSA